VINPSTDRGVKPKAIHFDGSASQGLTAPITGYAWDFGDHTPILSGPAVDHTFVTAGDYRVSLTVTDANGASDTAHQRIFISGTDLPPNASFIWAPDTTAALGVLFDAQKTVDVDGTVTQLRWDFGDGQSGSGTLPSHTYSRSGQYSVTLTALDDGGMQSVTSTVVSVGTPTSPSPPASPSPSPANSPGPSPSVSVLPLGIRRGPILPVTGPDVPLVPLVVVGLGLVVAGVILGLRRRARGPLKLVARRPKQAASRAPE
jgi:PKD repeat protein